MIVERLVWNVKPGKQDQLVEFLSTYVHDADNPMKRVYVPMIGGWGTVVAELEYENMAEWQKAWDVWMSPAKAAEVARENELGAISENTIWHQVA